MRFKPIQLIRFLSALFVLIWACTLTGAAQNRRQQVVGTIVDKSGEPLPGVAVYVKNQSSRGTSTNLDGQFVLSAAPNETLVVSAVSYLTKEVPASYFKDGTTLILEDDQEALEEAVVVGYGTQKKISVVGAVSTVNVAEVKAAPVASVSQALVGKVPGLVTRQFSGEPGVDQANLYIRGLATWGDVSPIIIVDGVERDLNTLNMPEIESISFLKDATATAVYGIRGANGVIIITTRHGKRGAPKVTLRSEAAVRVGGRFPNFLNSGEWAELFNEARMNDGYAPRYSSEEILKYYDQSDPYNYPYVDWIGEIFKKTTTQTVHNLNITGGTDRINYFVNFGFTDQAGLYKTDDRFEYNTNIDARRYNLRSNIDVKLAESLTAEVGLGYISQEQIHPMAVTERTFLTAFNYAPNKIPMYNPDGTFASEYFNGYVNPYMQMSNLGYKTTLNANFQGTFALKWDLSNLVTKGLTWNNTFTFDLVSYSSNDRQKVNDDIKSWQGYDRTGEEIYKVWMEKFPEGFSSRATLSRALRYYSQLNYNRSFGLHNLNGMLMFNMGSSIDVNAGSGVAALPYHTMGISGRAVYDYDARYIVEFSFGYNGSENFAPGHRFGFFPGVALGWNLAREPYWKVPQISTLKLRGSYGTVGNDRTGSSRFPYLSTTSSASGFYMGQNMSYYSGYTENMLGDENISWEVAKKLNIGLEYGMFDDKVLLGVDVFQEKRDGLLVQRSSSVPMASGFQTSQLPYLNLGKTQNRGIDAQLEIKNTTPGGFFYSVKGNISWSRSKIIFRDEPANQPDYRSQRGHSINAAAVLIAEGFFESAEDVATWPKSSYSSELRPGDVKYRDVNGDGVINGNDVVYLKYPWVPELNYGFGATLGYKGFDLTAFFVGSGNYTYGYAGYAVSVAPFIWGAEAQVQRYFAENRWRPGADNSNALFPRVSSTENTHNEQSSTLWVRTVHYLRLKNAEIGYTLPTRITDKIRLSSVRFFVNGINLLLWDNLKIYDPESQSGYGVDYPNQTTINGGVEITF